MTASSSEELREAIAREEARVARFEDERRLAQGRLDALRSELAALGARASNRLLPVIPEPARPETSAEKVTLFRQLFRGRDDLYPKLWTNTTAGRKGYAPACANEWVRGICEKPRVKCGECPNQAFLAVTDQVIRDHLQGRHVVGVYPLLTDETCWLVAADFDKRSWTDDVLAFAETCRMTRGAERRRAVAIGTGCPRLVLLRGTRPRRRRAEDGLLPAHRDHVPPPSARHGVLRPAVPESGHAPARRLRQSDRSTSPARAATGRKHRLRRRSIRPLP